MTQREWYLRANKYKKTLVKILKSEKYRGGTMICSHNTILCIKNTETDEIEFIIDTHKPRGLQMMSELNEHLAVPRYEPHVAKEWLKEEMTWNRDSLSFNDTEFSDAWESKRVKYTCGEHELRQEFKKYLTNQIEFCRTLAKTLKEKGIKEI